MLKGILVQVGPESFVVIETAGNVQVVSPRYRFLAEEAAAIYDIEIVQEEIWSSEESARREKEYYDQAFKDWELEDPEGYAEHVAWLASQEVS